MEYDFLCEAKVFTRLNIPEMLALWPLGDLLFFWLARCDECFDFIHQRFVSCFRAPVDCWRPVTVVRREHAARPQNASNLPKHTLRLHPVKRLGASHNVDGLILHRQLVGVGLEKGNVVCFRMG